MHRRACALGPWRRLDRFGRTRLNANPVSGKDTPAVDPDFRADLRNFTASAAAAALNPSFGSSALRVVVPMCCSRTMIPQAPWRGSSLRRDWAWGRIYEIDLSFHYSTRPALPASLVGPALRPCTGHRFDQNCFVAAQAVFGSDAWSRHSEAFLHPTSSQHLSFVVCFPHQPRTAKLDGIIHPRVPPPIISSMSVQLERFESRKLSCLNPRRASHEVPGAYDRTCPHSPPCPEARRCRDPCSGSCQACSLPSRQILRRETLKGNWKRPFATQILPIHGFALPWTERSSASVHPVLFDTRASRPQMRHDHCNLVALVARSVLAHPLDQLTHPTTLTFEDRFPRGSFPPS